jgi:hypothetical protein
MPPDAQGTITVRGLVGQSAAWTTAVGRDPRQKTSINIQALLITVHPVRRLIVMGDVYRTK